MAEYTKGNRIYEDPAFQWWVPYIIKKREVILSAVKARTRHAQVKYGIQIPRSNAEAKRLDDAAGNTLWQNSRALEMGGNRLENYSKMEIPIGNLGSSKNHKRELPRRDGRICQRQPDRR